MDRKLLIAPPGGKVRIKTFSSSNSAPNIGRMAWVHICSTGSGKTHIGLQPTGLAIPMSMLQGHTNIRWNKITCSWCFQRCMGLAQNLLGRERLSSSSTCFRNRASTTSRGYVLNMMPHVCIHAGGSARSNWLNWGHLELGPINWLRLFPDKSRNLANRALEPSLEHTMVWPYGVIDFNCSKQCLEFGGHIHVINPGGTLTCVTDWQAPPVRCNGLNVPKSSCFKDLEGRDVMLFEVKVPRYHPQPRWVQANLSGHCSQHLLIIGEVVWVPCASWLTIQSANRDPHVVKERGRHHHSAWGTEIRVPRDWHGSCRMSGQSRNSFPPSRGLGVRSHRNRMTSNQVPVWRLCDSKPSTKKWNWFCRQVGFCNWPNVTVLQVLIDHLCFPRQSRWIKSPNAEGLGSHSRSWARMQRFPIADPCQQCEKIQKFSYGLPLKPLLFPPGHEGSRLVSSNGIRQQPGQCGVAVWNVIALSTSGAWGPRWR